MTTTLINANCLNVMMELKEKSVDLILCSLPNDFKYLLPFDQLWFCYNKIIKDNGIIVLFGKEPFSSYLRISNMKDYKFDLYWVNEINSIDKKVEIETISIFYKDVYKNEKILNDTNQILKFKKDKHILNKNQKPIKLLEYLIETYSNKNELVLDNTMGIGNTGIACLNMDRKFIGIEKNKDYFLIAKNRIENYIKEDMVPEEHKIKSIKIKINIRKNKL